MRIKTKDDRRERIHLRQRKRIMGTTERPRLSVVINGGLGSLAEAKAAPAKAQAALEAAKKNLIRVPLSGARWRRTSGGCASPIRISRRASATRARC